MISAAVAIAAASAPSPAQNYGGDQAAASELRHAIERLAKAPTDTDALLDAGNAALILRDYGSALGFFTRAEALQPSSGRVKAGLGTAQLYSENPVEALKLYDQAIALGVNERSIAADRGLAYDLVGNNALAQTEYALGSTAVSTDDLIIRQAVSFGLSGDQKRADALLNPLLSQNKPPAWRARAFILAANGDVREATRIVRGFLDARSTTAMQAYLERMRDLTRAQQAAVIHYGHFPAEAQVGRDSEAVRAIAARGYVGRAATGTQDQGLIPAGEPLGRRSQARADPAAGSTRQARAMRMPTERPDRSARRAAAQASRAAVQAPATQVAAQNAAAASVPAASAVSGGTVQIAAAAPAPQDELPAVSPPFAGFAERQVTSAVPPSSSMSTATELAAASPPVPVAAQQAVAANDVPGDAATAAADIGPGFETLGNPEVLQQFTAAQAPASMSASSSAAVAPDDKPIVAASIAAGVPTPAAPQFGPPASAATVPSATASRSTSADAVPSLGAIVRAIDIPPEEKQGNVFAVDLARLEQYKDAKPLAPAQEETAEASPFSVTTLPKGAKPLDAAAAVSQQPTKAVKADAASAKTASAKDEPARNWVQIATGASDVMNSEYRRLARGKTELFKGQKGWTSPWRTQQRLLVGPFDSLGAARDWLGKYVEAGGAGFAWNSEAGTAVAPLR